MNKKVTLMRDALNDVYKPYFDALYGALDGHFLPYCGYRSFDEQEYLYRKGRSTTGSIVTNARAGQSYHNFGLASDWAPIDSKGKIFFPDASSKIWREYTLTCEKLGLYCISWERPHNQFQTSVPLTRIKNTYLKDGMLGVTKLLKGDK